MQDLSHLPDDELDRLYVEHGIILWHFKKIEPDEEAANQVRQHLEALRAEMIRRGISCGQSTLSARHRGTTTMPDPLVLGSVWESATLRPEEDGGLTIELSSIDFQDGIERSADYRLTLLDVDLLRAWLCG